MGALDGLSLQVSQEVCATITGIDEGTCESFATGRKGFVAGGYCVADCSTSPYQDTACYSSCDSLEAVEDDKESCSVLVTCAACVAVLQKKTGLPCSWSEGYNLCADDATRYDIQANGGLITGSNS